MPAQPRIPPPASGADPVKASCFYCRRGPTGMDGHPYLLVRSIGAVLTFRCQLCNGAWSRTRGATNLCVWSDVTGRGRQRGDEGMMLPSAYYGPL